MRAYRTLWLAFLALVAVGIGSVIADRWYAGSGSTPVANGSPSPAPTATPTPMPPIEDIG